jgi:hypothetical protein
MSSKITKKINAVVDLISNIFDSIQEAFVGIEGVINYVATKGIDIINALDVYGDALRPHVRRAAIIVERLIPDATPDAKLALFDRILKGYIVIDTAIDKTQIDDRLFAAARMLLESFLIERKVAGSWDGVTGATVSVTPVK